MTQLTLVQRQVTDLATRLGLENSNPAELSTVLKQTAFRGEVSDAQMTALLVVAKQYGLNPWTKELWAYPDRHNGIVPIVSVDGWSRIVNEHPQYDGVDFTLQGSGEDMAMTCRIYRKDRTRPTEVTEYLAECRRGTDPWKLMPKRMLRNKAFIQTARIAFGYGGIHDPEEGETIAGATQVMADGSDRPLMPASKKPTPAPAAASIEDAQIVDVTPKASTTTEAAPPQAAEGPADDDGELVTDGHRRNLEIKANAGGHDLAKVYARMGYKPETLTLSQFARMKAELAK